MNSISNPWDDYVRRIKEHISPEKLEEEELNYKLKISQKLAEARHAVLTSSNQWPYLAKSGVLGNLTSRFILIRFREWIDQSPGQAFAALKSIWAEGQLSISERIRNFSSQLPPESGIKGRGSRTSIISVLLMGINPGEFPPFRIRFFEGLYKSTGYYMPPEDADEATLYEHALGFLDTFIEQANMRGVRLRDRLEAQSVLYMLAEDIGKRVIEDDNTKGGKVDGREEIVDSDIAALARDTYLTEEFLQEIVELLEDKKQVIFQGPPGTGKTYVAQALAECLTASKHRVTLVQFHPSYAYEDFVQGFRPKQQDNGQPGFELQDGPLLRAASEAIEDPEEMHFLVIDEINRGNLAKVFGELYFLLEYRDKPMSLQYSNTSFYMPDNLHIIGTMNTADRSIALVDLALRRRFHFVEFHPDDDPVKGVLRRYLGEKAPGMSWVADVVERANEILKEDRDAAIGPSYFMKDNLTEDLVQRIWKHNVLPYLKELLYGRDEELAKFNLDALRSGAASGNGESEAPSDPQSEE